MTAMNKTSLMEFILSGLSKEPRLQVPLFVFFLLVYIITLLGNISMIALIWASPRLHTPMYFLLRNLSFVDICYSSVITPTLLSTFLSVKKAISFNGCVTQFFFLAIFGTADSVLLAAMAYDRYIAICNPLLYSTLMTKKICICLIVGAYSISLLSAIVNTGSLFRLNFCGSNRIAHFYCDPQPLLKLSCSDTTLNELLLGFFVGSVIGISFILIVFSYVYIITSIIGIHSSEGRLRAFSTCASHFTCVIMFYSPIFFMYLKPTSTYSNDQDKVASVFYTVIIPMLNPFVYSLRNQEVKVALQNVKDKAKAIHWTA